MSQATPFTPLQLGNLSLPNRIIMAPMTRMRATDERIPTELMATYYAQRASAGLIITEGVIVMPEGAGYRNTPGLYNDEQVAAWRVVTEAVHAAGGRIFAQLWHTGRVSHSSFQPGGKLPVAPSAVPAVGEVNTAAGKQPYETPHALEMSEIREIVKKFGVAAQRAKDAGFDGVEIHGANGYLLDQFLRDGANKRTDQYGGSLENRARFLLEVVDAVKKVWSLDRIGVRLSPSNDVGGLLDSDPVTSFTYYGKALAEKKVGYIHILEAIDLDREKITPAIRKLYQGVLIVNKSYDKALMADVLTSGRADAVSFGKDFISNPDLPIRFHLDAPMNELDWNTVYGIGSKGYVDYPALVAETA